MKNKLITAIIFLIVLSTIGFAGCRGEEEETSQRQITEVTRGDLLVTVPADGNLDMPRDVQLKFGTPGTVKAIYVEEGQKVKEGTLLASLDDTTQKLAIASAQYNVELATNELVEKIHPTLMGYPGMYPDTSTVLRVEQAQDELVQAQKFLEQGRFQEAAAELRLAIHDLNASYKMLNIPQITTSLQGYSDILGTPVENYPDISRAIKLLEQDLSRLAEIQTLIENGNYENADIELKTAQNRLKETHLLVKSLSGRVIVSQRIGTCCPQLAGQKPGTSTGLMPLPYPDTSTSLAWLRQVEEELQKIQACKDTGGCDALELSTLLRMAQHDVEMSQAILENNELTFLSGLNLKALRGYNLNLQIAEQELKRYKEELMKTEILAPFDGTVVDIGVKENDQLSSFDYSSKTAVYLVDTRTVEMDGVVDEIDIYKVKVGEEAIIIVDALPDVELKGKVTFVSPFGSRETGVVEFPVTISLEPTEIELKGGLTATADIIVEKHENVLLIPNRSIKGSPGDYWVEVVLDEKGMTTEKRPVELGAQNEQFSVVISGLNEGEKIIVEATRGRLPTSF
ncbi:MAG: efflux RND transporter periplasmic adaptor subunit [Chloroflexota bacterium]|nr:MAG: efflux RND transporter periplasmic adaptor subunit [Chloroflexota bacterium]